MRLTHAQLRFKALCALDEALEQCSDAPVPKSGALAFAIAYLWATSRAAPREPFDRFWKAVTRPLVPPRHPAGEGIGRSQNGTAAMNAIHRELTVTAEEREALRNARIARYRAKKGNSAS